MKPNRKDCLLLLGALAISLVLLMVTRPSTAQPLQQRQAGKRRTIPFVASFVDFGQRQPSISCEISVAGHQREVGSVGFTAQQRAIWLSQKMYERAKQELSEVNERLAVFSCSTNVFPSSSVPPDRDWEVKSPVWCSTDDQGFVTEAQRVVGEWIHSLDREKEGILQEFYRSRRIRVVSTRRTKVNGEEEFLIDYASVVNSATPLLSGCAQALFKAGGGRLDANLLAAFLQQLKYVKLNPGKSEYHVHDFLVPTQVLVEKRGDCDSKSAAFCSLWRTYSKDVILLLSDRHALIGYKAPPNTPLPTIPIKGIRYIACDVSGLHRFSCGNTPPGDYRPVFLNN